MITSYDVAGQVTQVKELDYYLNLVYSVCSEIGISRTWKNGARTVFRIGYRFCLPDRGNQVSLDLAGPYVQAGFAFELTAGSGGK
jgi:hypothetical protein